MMLSFCCEYFYIIACKYTLFLLIVKAKGEKIKRRFAMLCLASHLMAWDVRLQAADSGMVNL